MLTILVSGDGMGAGKTTFANQIKTHERYSLADQIRLELSEKYPEYPWMGKSQETKKLLVSETGKTIREMLIERGQQARIENPLIWCIRLKNQLEKSFPKGAAIIIDDVRYLNEIEYFKGMGQPCIHFHLESENAAEEPQYDNSKLKLAADYIVRWGARF